ncbi:MAG: hypothetical protein COB53_09390 [Elusimicrobia bacterium]|nr:MAG: hypothetical protein COB53_09390 [Elusimicrobiota bacterium]
MIKRDFILRLIDKAAIFLMKAIGFRKDGDLPKSEAAIREAFKSLLGLEAKLVEAMAAADLISLLGVGGEPDPGKLVVAAQLLEERAEQYGAQIPAFQTHVKSLTIFLNVHLLPGKADYLDRTQDVHRLLKRLGESGFDLPAEVDELVSRFNAAPR